MRLLRTTGLSLGVVAASLFASAGTSEPFAPALNSLADLLPDRACLYVCASCNTKHSILEAGPLLEPDTDSAHGEFCQPGSCPAGHGSCGGGGGGVTWAPFERALYAAAPSDVQDLLAEHADQVVFNEARGAVQVLGCNDQVIASYSIATAD